MASYKTKFVDGAKEKGVNKTAIEIFELLENLLNMVLIKVMRLLIR